MLVQPVAVTVVSTNVSVSPAVVVTTSIVTVAPHTVTTNVVHTVAPVTVSKVVAPIVQQGNPTLKSTVKHTPTCKVKTQGSSSSKFELDRTFDVTLYDVLNMQDQLKTLEYNGIAKNEFEIFLDYAEKLTAQYVEKDPYETFLEYMGRLRSVHPVDTSGFSSLNSFIGSLGVVHGIC